MHVGLRLINSETCWMNKKWKEKVNFSSAELCDRNEGMVFCVFPPVEKNEPFSKKRKRKKTEANDESQQRRAGLRETDRAPAMRREWLKMKMTWEVEHKNSMCCFSQSQFLLLWNGRYYNSRLVYTKEPQNINRACCWWTFRGRFVVV